MNLMRRPLTLLPPYRLEEMNDLFRRYLAPTYEGAAWTPAVRLEETENEVVVIAEVPGVEPKDLVVTVDGRELTLAGEKKAPQAVNSNTCLWDEISYGAFSRQINLPVDVVSDKTAADYKGGFVRITLPKAPSARRTKITVNVAKG